jgi:general secretion pathway protein L
MSPDLVLHIRETGIDWRLVSSERGATLSQGRLEAGADAPAGWPTDIARTLVLLPAESVFVSRLALPTRSVREARQAAPFMIEDQLATPVEDMVVQVGPAGPDGLRWCLAVSGGQLADWMAACARLLRGRVHTLPESLVAVHPDAALSLRRLGSRLVFCFRPDVCEPGESIAGGAELAFAESALPALAQRAGQGGIAASASLGLAGNGMTRLEEADIAEMASRMPRAEILALPCLFVDKAGARVDWGALARPFARPAAVAAATAVLFCGLWLGEGFYLKQRAQTYDAAVSSAVAQAFPEIAGRLDAVRARRILEQRVAEASGGGDEVGFLHLSAALAELAQRHPGVAFDHVRYEAGRRELGVSARYATFADFDAMTESARSLGLELLDQGARETGQGVAGDFTLRLP